MNLNSYPSVMTVEETMELLKIGRGTCYKLLNAGILKGFRPGNRTWRIPKTAIEEFITVNENKTNQHR